MIVRITFNDGRVMLFGNSYKPWSMQFDEYMWKIRGEFKPIKFESCKDNWIAWGGLKWCDDEGFQHQLNREGCQTEDEDNTSPRQYKYMMFVENNLVKNKVKKIMGVNKK